MIICDSVAAKSPEPGFGDGWHYFALQMQEGTASQAAQSLERQRGTALLAAGGKREW